MSGGSSGGGSQDTNTQSRNEPWAATQPYIINGYKDAARLYSQGPAQYTPWGQVAQLNSDQNAAIDATNSYVNAPGTQAYMNGASNTVQRLLNGANNPYTALSSAGQSNLAGYLSGNNVNDPSQGINRFLYQDTRDPSLINNVMGATEQANGVYDKLTGMIQNQGGFGQKIADQSHSMNMANSATNMLSDAYINQNVNRLNAINLANGNKQSQMNIIGSLLNNNVNFDTTSKSMGLSNYSPVINTPLTLLGALNQMGGVQQNYTQSQLNDATNRWNFNQNAAYDNLVKYRNLINPDPSWGTTNTIGKSTATPTKGNAMGSALGGAAAGASMGSMFGPWGTAIGAVAGGLMGGLSQS
ncbi:hypothetical protein [Methylobacter sp.]|uniref:hypothetical protein n=1 Tax=Methylobacter sp. TaxID=2051955 RepID=UPI003DA4D047